jgi:hypothetical protein
VNGAVTHLYQSFYITDKDITAHSQLFCASKGRGKKAIMQSIKCNHAKGRKSDCITVLNTKCSSREGRKAFFAGFA